MGVGDGDSESSFGADGVSFAELGAGGGVEEGADLVLPLGAAGPDGGPGVLAFFGGEGPGVAALVACGVECFYAGDVFGGLTYSADPFVISR